VHPTIPAIGTDGAIPDLTLPAERQVEPGATVAKPSLQPETLVRRRAMPYAVFEQDERLTRVFATEQEAWDVADVAGLVEIAPDGTRAPEDHLEIRPCADDPKEPANATSDFIT
jgi:hypothetical protein